MGGLSSKRSQRNHRMTVEPFEGWLDKQLKSKRFAANFLTEAFQNGSEDEFLVAIHDVVRAHNGVKALSETTGVSRQHLHKIFSGKASPTLLTLKMMLNALGFTLDVVPIRDAA